MELVELKKIVALNGGATLNHKGQLMTLEHGYMVSLADNETTTTLEALSEKLIRRYFKLAKKKHAYVGLWLDAGALYLDLSIKVSDKVAARKIGKHNNQIAIYDLATQNSIYLN